MIYIEKVQGSAQAALPFIVNVDTIYLHTNIKKIEPKEEDIISNDLYEYTERQYSFAEFGQYAEDVLASLEDDVLASALTQLKEKQII